MIYKYNNKRARYFKRLMFAGPRESIVFSYGDTAFKFVYGKHTIEVSRYDSEIVIRKIK